MFRKVLLTSVLVVLGVGLALLAPWASHANQPWAILSSSLQRLGAAQERSEELDHKIAADRSRSSSGNQVIEELVQGRLSLLEAASWWHQNYAELATTACPSSAKESSSPEERACRQVILRVKGSLKDSKASYRTEVIDRLEAELRKRLSQPYRMVFPKPPEVPEIAPSSEHHA